MAGVVQCTPQCVCPDPCQANSTVGMRLCCLGAYTVGALPAAAAQTLCVQVGVPPSTTTQDALRTCGSYSCSEICIRVSTLFLDEPASGSDRDSRAARCCTDGLRASVCTLATAHSECTGVLRRLSSPSDTCTEVDKFQVSFSQHACRNAIWHSDEDAYSGRRYSCGSVFVSVRDSFFSRVKTK